jgi:hypothetical protein
MDVNPSQSPPEKRWRFDRATGTDGKGRDFGAMLGFKQLAVKKKY